MCDRWQPRLLETNEAMTPRRFGIIGTGFWSRYQLAAWRQFRGARCVALCNRTREKAEALGRDFGISNIYTDAEEMLLRERLDFVDIITDVGTHKRFTELAAKHGVPVICQKPLARSLTEAEQMIRVCRTAGIPLAVHENWRWQRPLRELKRALTRGAIGKVFRARIDYCNSFPVFQNQPLLKELEQFILTDMGTHILDVARFLFGEAARLYCQTHQVHADIKGEDAATVMMSMVSGATVTCNLSYASKVEHDRFPEAFVFVEGTRGSLELGPDFWIRETTAGATHARRYPPPFYPWADPRYALVHASIVDCNRDLLQALTIGAAAETSAEDNLNTLKLVFAAYKSAAQKQTIQIT
jgi:predicted dehydrogenase